MKRSNHCNMSKSFEDFLACGTMKQVMLRPCFVCLEFTERIAHCAKSGPFEDIYMCVCVWLLIYRSIDRSID